MIQISAMQNEDGTWRVLPYDRELPIMRHGFEALWQVINWATNNYGAHGRDWGWAEFMPATGQFANCTCFGCRLEALV